MFNCCRVQVGASVNGIGRRVASDCRALLPDCRTQRPHCGKPRTSDATKIPYLPPITDSNGRLNFNRPFDNGIDSRREAMLATEFTRFTWQRADHASGLPPCPNCGRPMFLARTTPRGGLPDLCVFKCGECAVYLSESADDLQSV
jgi:hypothetical protein